jgi:hypothetical protein
MRVIVSAMRGEEVSAERMSRVASAEREALANTGEPPRLCSAILPAGTAPPRRIWAKGSWRLARRIITKDAEPAWYARTGLTICDLVLRRQVEDSRLSLLGHELAVRSIGAAHAFEPQNDRQWEELRGAFASFPMGPGISTHTNEQGEAERSLIEAGFGTFALFFGLEASAGIHRGRRPKGLRLALGGEPDAQPFDELVRSSVDGDSNRARTVLAYIEAFGRQMDEEGRPPSIGRYASRWGIDIATAKEEQNAFSAVFPEEENPSAILDLLWGGTGANAGAFTRLLGVKVVRAGSFPTVNGYFVTCLADELRDPAGPRVMEAAMEFDDSPPDPRREQRRFFALCARASEVWCAEALQQMGDEASLLGLRSLEPVHDEATARYMEQMLGEYRLENRDKDGKGVLLATQKALRVAASLRLPDPPPSTQPYLDGIRWAAKALVAMHRELDVDITGEAKRTTARIDAVSA